MTNDDIGSLVHQIAEVLRRDAHINPGDSRAVDAGVALMVNLLQNINTIAIAAKSNALLGKAHSAD